MWRSGKITFAQTSMSIRVHRALILIIAVTGCIVAAALLLNRNVPIDSHDELARYIPGDAFEQLKIVTYHGSTFAKYPEYNWQLQFKNVSKDTLLKAGFNFLDKPELIYVQRVLNEEFPDVFLAESDDVLLGKETDRFDVQLLLKPSKQ